MPETKTSMDAREALDLTMRVYDIKAIDLADSSGIAPVMISRYRNLKRDMTSSSVFKLVNSLPKDAKEFFIKLVFGDDEINSYTDTQARSLVLRSSSSKYKA